MACKVAGADDVDELWDLLCKAESQHVEVTPDRIDFRTTWRDVDLKRKWFGNFICDPEAFDHRFFKKSPCEAASQDPQQRQLLQVAYQAVEQSGYFGKLGPQREKRVGCYIGVVSTDCENNIACHAACRCRAWEESNGRTAARIRVIALRPQCFGPIWDVAAC